MSHQRTNPVGARQRTYDAMLRKAKALQVTGGTVYGYDNVRSPSVCLLARWARDLNVRDVGDPDVARVNRDCVRYAHEQVFASSEAAARSARTIYTKLRDRGEAHVKPVNFMIAEVDGAPRPV